MPRHEIIALIQRSAVFLAAILGLCARDYFALVMRVLDPGRCRACRFSAPTWDGLVVDLVGVLFRVVQSQAADREIDDFMTVPRSRPARREARPVA